ncbi:MAG: 2Fe-2S iron-sulfur cluster binding domain-containing protein [Alphaproteobacteria bacterium]|nr:MAG: 2Fe-2S iron-sulfur cluster binding domain-containing protein [Alphaproteobacteria bacterium]
MAKVTFIEGNGAEHEVSVDNGLSLMEAAVNNMVPGIDADCGGACACATCHVYVEPEWEAKTGNKTEMEETMLDFAEGTQENSRLACQIKISDDLDGLVVRLPEAQF